MNLAAYSRLFNRLVPLDAPGGTGGILLRVEGFQSLVASLGRFSAGLQPTADRTDRLLAIATTAAMQMRAPKDTGRLGRGITWEKTRDGYAIQATAADDNDPYGDYALFQEFGTEAMDANPFFWDTARMILGDRIKRHDRALDELAIRSGLAAHVSVLAREFGEGVLVGMADDLFSLFGD